MFSDSVATCIKLSIIYKHTKRIIKVYDSCVQFAMLIYTELYIMLYNDIYNI